MVNQLGKKWQPRRRERLLVTRAALGRRTVPFWPGDEADAAVAEADQVFDGRARARDVVGGDVIRAERGGRAVNRHDRR
jgi:hypothetical protein